MASETQDTIKAGTYQSLRELDGRSGPEILGVACKGCDGVNAYAVRCRHNLCRKCCLQQTQPCPFHKKGRA